MEHATEHVMGPGVMEAIKLANIVIVGIILYLAAGKAIREAIQARAESIAQKITGSKKELEKIQSELSAAKNEFARLSEMKNQILNQVRQEGERMAASIIQDAQSVANRIVSDAKIAAGDEARVAAQKLREKIVEESIQRSVKMLSESGSAGAATHEKMVNKFLAGMGEGSSSSRNGANV